MATTDTILQQVHLDLQTAKEKVVGIETKLAEARSEVADLEAFVRTYERYSNAAKSGNSDSGQVEPRKNKSRSVPERGTQARNLVDTCIEAIRDNGGPMKIGDLLDVVLDEGLTLGGRDQKSNLAGYLSRDPRTKSLGRSVGWDVVETEEAALEPSSEEAASSNADGGSDERTTLASSGLADLL